MELSLKPVSQLPLLRLHSAGWLQRMNWEDRGVFSGLVLEVSGSETENLMQGFPIAKER
jgi:hypothetical protein